MWMKRRSFVTAGAAIAASGAAMPQSSPALLPSRLSRLTDTNEGEVIVQDLCYWKDIVYCLYRAARTRRWGVTATAQSGMRRWQKTLPNGAYLGLGIRGGQVLIHALHFENAGGVKSNCILTFDAEGNDTGESLALSDSSPMALRFAGDSRMIRVNSGSAELWDVGSSRPSRVSSKNVSLVDPVPHIDIVDPGSALIALTPRDGKSIVAIDAASGSVNEHSITDPKVLSAIEAYKATADPRRGSSVVLPATGCDRGSLYMLVLPATPAEITSVKADRTFKTSAWRTFAFQPRTPRNSIVPMKLFPLGSELAMVYPDASVVWYTIQGES